MRSSIVPRQTNLWTSDVLLLADAEGAIGRLVLDGRVPPAVEVHDVRGGRQVQARAAGLEREHEERRALLLLERVDEALALRDGDRAVEQEPRPTEHVRQERRERAAHLAELGEDEHLLLARRDGLADLAKPRELAAGLRRPHAVAEPLRRVVADLLEAQERREDRAAPLRCRLASVEGPRQIVDGALVEHGLDAASARRRP